MNINLNNCFSDDDTFPQLNSNIKEFDDDVFSHIHL